MTGPKSDKPANLHMQSETVLHHVVKDGLLAYESRTELIAIVTASDDVEVFRLGGQRVLSLKQKELTGVPTCIRWASHGTTLSKASGECC